MEERRLSVLSIVGEGIRSEDDRQRASAQGEKAGETASFARTLYGYKTYHGRMASQRQRDTLYA
jgi:hypothetical protein